MWSLKEHTIDFRLEFTRDIETGFAELLDQDYPRFSDTEFERRRRLAYAICERDDLDAVIVAQSMRAGTATFWYTGWPVTQEAVTVISRGRRPRLYVQYFNHVPLARKLAADIDVYWGEDSGLRLALEFVRSNSPKLPRLVSSACYHPISISSLPRPRPPSST